MIFYTPKVVERLIFVTFIQKLTMRVLIVVWALVNRIETLVVLHLLEAEMNQDLWSFMKFMSDAAFNWVVTFRFSLTICFSVKFA